MSVAWNAHFDLLARYKRVGHGPFARSGSRFPTTTTGATWACFSKVHPRHAEPSVAGEHRLWFVRFSEGTSPRVALDAEIETDRHRLAAASLREGAARCR